MRHLFPLLILQLLASIAAAGPCPVEVAGKPVAIATEAAAIAAAKEAWRSVREKVTWDSYFSQQNVARFEPYRAILQGSEWHVLIIQAEAVSESRPRSPICMAQSSKVRVSLTEIEKVEAKVKM